MKGIKNIRESFKTRQVKYGGYAALITLAVIAGLILVNLMIGQFPSAQIDMTWSGVFSLTEQTLQVLDQLNSPVQIYGLWQPGERIPLPNNREYVDDVTTTLNLYLSRNSNISLEVLDPDRHPGFMVNYDRDRTGIPRGSVIVEGDKGFRIISINEMYDISQNQQGGIDITGVAIERRITSAILYVGSGTSPVIYELIGHDQRPLTNFGINTFLESDNYVLRQINLLLSDIPDDASVIILHDPQKDLTPMEAEKILDYLEKGGRFFVLTDYRIRELENLNMVLTSYGVNFDYGIVHETDPENAGLVFFSRVDRPNLHQHEITELIADRERTPVILRETMPIVELQTRRRSVQITPFMTSSPGAFLRRDLDETSPERLPEDLPGPFSLGVAIADPPRAQSGESQTRIVAIGSSVLLDFSTIGFDANRDLFLNSIAWLQDRPETITVRSKSLYSMPMRLSIMQIIIYGALFIAVIPLGFFITGLVVWLKRRHL